MTSKLIGGQALGLTLISKGIAMALRTIPQKVLSVAYKEDWKSAHPMKVEVVLKFNRPPYKEKDAAFAFAMLRYDLQAYDKWFEIALDDQDTVHILYKAKEIAKVGRGVQLKKDGPHYWLHFSDEIFNTEMVEHIVKAVKTYTERMDYVNDEVY